jgi:dTDP-4-dehydrorhamnose reductase
VGSKASAGKSPYGRVGVVKILVTGGSGYLGGEVVGQAVTSRHEVHATYASSRPGRSDVVWSRLDVRECSDVETLVGRLRPHVVIHTAYVQSDWRTTADGAVHVAKAAARHGARLVHVSSDAVFSGTEVFYDEGAAPDPITPYGEAKAAAEAALRVIDPGAAIVRTSLIMGDGRSHVETLIHEIATRKRDGVLFTDEVRCPVHVSDLASALLEFAGNAAAGTLHVAGADAVTRHELGSLVALRDGLDPGTLRTGRRADLLPHTPVDVRLICTKTASSIRTRLRGAREFLTLPLG